MTNSFFRKGNPEYYETFPSKDHRAGDVWVNFPTYGVLPRSLTPALVISPACDLANSKIETLTYLPVLSIDDFLSSREMLRQVLNYLEQELRILGLGSSIFESNGPFLCKKIVGSAIHQFEGQIQNLVRLKARQKEAIRRCQSGFKLVEAIVSHQHPGNSIQLYRNLIGGKQFDKDIRGIVTNSFRPDIYFLPPDEQPLEFSAVKDCSIVMFRYPLTIPVDVLDAMSESSVQQWSVDFDHLVERYPCAAAFSEKTPLKILNLRPNFFSDLVARFIGLFGRLGSPDFPTSMVDRFVFTIGGPK